MFCNFKSSWITQEEGMSNKTNVASVAMCIYGQVVSFSMDHSKLKEALSEGGGTGVNNLNRSPIIGMSRRVCLFRWLYVDLHCIVL